MRRFIKVMSIGMLVLLCGCAAAVWLLAFRMPATDRQPLPDGLLAADSPEGRALLEQSTFRADYDALERHFVAQSRRAFCGVATSVIALNALRDSASPSASGTAPVTGVAPVTSVAPVTQESFFTDAARAVRSPLQVTFGGMSLPQLRDLLRAHGLQATLFHAADTDYDTFHAVAAQNLKSAGDLVLVNYQRAGLGQKPMGHISPLAAYHAPSDRFLVLDVAAWKYPPVWVSAPALWQAMSTEDPSSGRSRGFVVVREGR